MPDPHAARKKSNSSNLPVTPGTKREEFLIVMYGKMWDNINRHVTVVWQATAVLGGATAVFALVEKGALSIDIATALLVLVAGWLILHAYDANSWYSRNLAIIANIERQFLKPSDVREIHYFWRHHRRPELIEHLQIHAVFGVLFATLILSYHFSVRVWPGLHSPLASFESQRSLPYVMALLAALGIGRFRREYLKKFKKFERESPGRKVE